MQTPVKQSLFCVRMFFIFLCANIIPKATDIVKETTGGMQGRKCNAFGKKGVAAQRLI